MVYLADPGNEGGICRDVVRANTCAYQKTLYIYIYSPKSHGPSNYI